MASALSSINFPPFNGNYPSMNEMLENALSNASLPFDFSELNLGNDENLSFGPSREQLSALKSEIESHGSLQSYISAALASGNQPPSLVAAALAVRDTSNHTGLNVDDTLSMLMVEPAFPSPGDGFPLETASFGPNEASNSSRSLSESRSREKTVSEERGYIGMHSPSIVEQVLE